MKLQMAQQYQRAGKNHEALELLKQILSEQPDNVDALFTFANLQLSQKRHGTAKPVLENIIELDSSHVLARLKLSSILFEEGRLEEMRDMLSEAEALAGDNIDLLVRVGAVYQKAGLMEPAEQVYLKGEKIDSSCHQIYSALSAVYKAMGQMEKSKQYSRQAITKTTQNGGDYYSLIHISKPSEVMSEIKEMEIAYQAQQGSSNHLKQRMFLAYGLGRAYESMGQYEKAFAYLLDANQCESQLKPYFADKIRKRFEDIKAVFSEKFFHLHRETGVDSETPIFIVGMPRSGTTLTEQIFASHPQVFGAGELGDMHDLVYRINTMTAKGFPLDINVLTKAQCGKFANRYLGKLQALSGGVPRVTDKMPSNFLYIGLINLLFPKAKIIHCSRNPLDNCLSLFRNTFAGSHPYSHDLKSLGEYYGQYVDLMNHWHQVLPYKIYDVVYEDLVANTEEEVRAMLSFCGLPFDKACLTPHETERKVVTASAGEVRSPISSKSIDSWRRFEHQLQPLVEALDMRGEVV
jgi:tetratricopeptide (TPR) repeat protein